MKIEITIQRMDHFYTLVYSGVRKLLFLNNKIILDLYKDYKYLGPDLRDFNTSTTAFHHTIYGVVSIHCLETGLTDSEVKEEVRNLNVDLSRLDQFVE